MRRLLIPLVLLLAVAGGLFWWFSPEQVVKRRTKDLLEIFTFDAGSSRANREMGGLKLTPLLAQEVSVDVPEVQDANGSFSKSDIESGFHSLCALAKETKFTLQHYDSIVIGGDQATVIATVDALVDLRSYRPADGPGELTLVWKKAKDGWQLTTLAWREKRK
ncbi:hypothetical protein KBB96_00105 [Luteolibacter ambystomatis]|uniref:Uncharacterized protein n=1 Tax=Luteolibacter ambystomatis TaxID=2824561 RepID=A0A975G984_9BACT|nr:hypothetical protein [Luteolibacter ambystomatis]QUE51318.1 hypothetical protein KBB96_00105 [Luteolibacter ambystomatis]